jgi:uncharacterized membrane protein YedE/YeeE
MEREHFISARRFFIFTIAVGIAITAYSAFSSLWVLTAIPIGFLFGFFLEKADLCGSSAFSEVLLMKDAQKLFGIWVLIVVSMLGFAALSAMGLITLNPKPLQWANAVIGGLAFGVGIVLAGGCISGCLFKSGQGNINSMAGLLGIPLGIGIIEYGPLNGFKNYISQFVIKNAEGGPVTLPSLTGLPYGALALVFAGITIAAAWQLRKRKRSVSPYRVKADDMPIVQRIITRPWRPWQAGIAIGILAAFAWMSSMAAVGRNYPLGVTHGVLNAQLLLTDAPLTHVYAKPATPAPPAPTPAAEDPKSFFSAGDNAPKPVKKVNWWLILLVTSLVAGANFSARLSRKIRFLPRPPEQTVVAFFGGILLGAGAAIAGGCVVGNIMSGFALMSVGNIIFGATVLAANWTTTFIYHMGGEMH